MADLFTLAELAAYSQRDSIDATTGNLLLELTTGAIESVATFPDGWPVVVKAIGLTVAARAYNNPQGVVSESMGGYSYTRNQGERRTGIFLTEEERNTIAVAGGGSGGAFAVDTVGCSTSHADICALNFGALYCSCGASLTLAGPLYEDC